MYNDISVKRQRPVEPVRAQEVSKEVSKEATSEEAISFLNEFMTDIRKEIRKREVLTMKGKLSESKCDVITFISDNFSLTIDFTGGIAV